jgi:hypothetical protein
VFVDGTTRTGGGAVKAEEKMCGHVQWLVVLDVPEATVKSADGGKPERSDNAAGVLPDVAADGSDCAIEETERSVWASE